jgi:NADPH:quinone reductase-like Zn-dependent oxidoreductase
MKGIVLETPGGLENIKFIDMPDPGPPGPGEIRVRMHASSLNFHDYLVVTSKKTLPGHIPMSDGAGVVEALGAGVTEFKIGDAVVSCFFPTWHDGPPPLGDFSKTPGDGLPGYAREFVVAPFTSFTHVPQGYSHQEAATLTTAGLTAWRALIVDGSLKPGDVILTLGTGGVSIFALQIAKRMGARVIATSSSDEKLERLRALGADHVINYRKEEKWGHKVRDLSGGPGVDHVIEIGGAGTLGQSISATRVGGHIALIGVLAGGIGEVPTGAVLGKQIRLQGLLVGSRRHQKDFVRGLSAMGIKPVIDRSFPLSELAQAFQYEKSGSHFGKICLEIF